MGRLLTSTCFLSLSYREKHISVWGLSNCKQFNINHKCFTEAYLNNWLFVLSEVLGGKKSLTLKYASLFVCSSVPRSNHLVSSQGSHHQGWSSPVPPPCTDHPSLLTRDFSHDAHGLRQHEGQSSSASLPAIGHSVGTKISLIRG